MIFDNWETLYRTLVVGLLGYAVLVAFLRSTGKRTMSKWNSFDAVVTIALGSTFATMLLSKQTALAEGVLALALLIGVQYVITWGSVRSTRVRRWIKSDPTLLLRDGRFLDEMLRAERVTRDEVLAAVRASGQATLSEVAAVVLETDGGFSVIARIDREPSALANVRGWDDMAASAGARRSGTSSPADQRH